MVYKWPDKSFFDAGFWCKNSPSTTICSKKNCCTYLNTEAKCIVNEDCQKSDGGIGSICMKNLYVWSNDLLDFKLLKKCFSILAIPECFWTANLKVYPTWNTNEMRVYKWHFQTKSFKRLLIFHFLKMLFKSIRIASLID